MRAQPLILLTFSNDKDDYLPKIVEEQKAIQKALLDAQDNNYLEVRHIQHASTAEIFYFINRYHDQVRILHYGGHANGSALQLEKEIGVIQMANVKGIAGLLGTQKNLKLVFLNGCGTKGQVTTLLAQGIPAVVATSVSIEDNQAQLFSGQFYDALSNGSSIREAFIKAKSFLEAGENAPQIMEIEQTRGEGSLDALKEQIPWGLYYAEGSEEVLNWKLPTESIFSFELSENGPTATGNTQANSYLVNPVLKAIQKSAPVKALAVKIRQLRAKGDSKRTLTDAEKKGAIIEAYPAPISIHLQSLFSAQHSKKLDEGRLKRILTTYQYIMEFLSFIILADIWGSEEEKLKSIKLHENERLCLEAFFSLNTQLVPTYSYFLLADILLKIAHRQGIPFYVEDLNNYADGWSAKAKNSKADEHFQRMRIAVEEDIPARLIESFCIKSEKHLTDILCELNFLANYKLAVIKNISVLQIKNMPPTRYEHTLVELDNSSNNKGIRDRPQEFDKPTDMKSVLLYKDNLKDHISLSPFILDENSLIGETNYKLRFYGHILNDQLQFKWIGDQKDVLDLDKNKYGYIKQQFEIARKLFMKEEKHDRGIEKVKKEKNGIEDIL